MEFLIVFAKPDRRAKGPQKSESLARVFGYGDLEPDRRAKTSSKRKFLARVSGFAKSTTHIGSG
ncbi:Hypothetical protein [Corynebacterium glutamicum ATCC 13032]|uniref:Uncharacterized protein n=1 Tax=Corynebacterium glutamicum (strain ATCC 13032 / DSM 20300 / JCM 1318 / BCRC 11384 / CCUG 27702 / LMG 3730 / NBRC 12168 / NCIMB 10025 / NRRL B-2784 / 534) TaxID=196627 RepID=Q8NSQ9_CORGL|nr:Hypothetical protein [Corynebacterium glutamicum ATCC 13032]